MNVTREVFCAFIKRNPHLVATPVEGTTIAAMQYLDSDGKVRAQAIYSKPVQAPNVKVIPSYVICEEGV
jgi:hypothetical protein